MIADSRFAPRWGLVFGVLLLGVTLTACASSHFLQSPNSQTHARDKHLALLQAHLSQDKSFQF
ncbi:MAG: hypothetical protein ACRCTY_02300, partial [Candidatus Adiutrix sp.]